MCQVTSLQESLTRLLFNQQQLLVATLFLGCYCHLSRWSQNSASHGEASGENTRGGGAAMSQALAIPAPGKPGHCGGKAGGAEHQSPQPDSVSAPLQTNQLFL